jgi:hypothetical protein
MGDTTPTISFGDSSAYPSNSVTTPAIFSFTTASFTLTKATSTVSPSSGGGAITYSSSDPLIATVQDTSSTSNTVTITILKAQSTSDTPIEIKAEQAPVTGKNQSASKSFYLRVNKVAPVFNPWSIVVPPNYIAGSGSEIPIVAPQLSSSSRPDSTANNYTFSYSSADSGIAEIVGTNKDKVILKKTGPVLITAKRTPENATSANYLEGTITTTVELKNFTFKSENPIIKHDGENTLSIRFDIKSSATDVDSMIKPGFKQLFISVKDQKTGVSLAAKDSYLTKDIKNYLTYGKFVVLEDSQKLTTPLNYIEILVDTKDSSAVSFKARENGEYNSDYDYPVQLISIKKRPSPPKVVVEAPKISLVDGKITFTGSVKVTPVPNEGVDEIFLNVSGNSGDGDYFEVRSERIKLISPVPLFYTFELKSGGKDADYIGAILAKINDLKPDSQLRISAHSHANNSDSAESVSVAIESSIRLPSPVLTVAKSLQDKKITVSGNLVKGSATSQYSIMGQELPLTDSIIDPTKWKLTNIRNKTISSDVSVSQILEFSHDITQLDGVDVPDLTVIAFIAIQHSPGQPNGIDETKSVDIDDDEIAKRPPLDQSSASNELKAVTISYLNKSLGIDAGQQTGGNATVKALSFSPKFINIANAENVEDNTLKPSGKYRYVFKFTSSKRGDVKTPSSNSANVVTIPSNFFVDPEPLVDDQYTISCSFTAPLVSSLLEVIGPNSELPIVKSETGGSIVNLGTVSTKVRKSRIASELPKITDLTPSVVKVVGTNSSASKRLAASWRLSYDDTVFLKNVQIQVASGFSSETQFTPLTHGVSGTTLSAGRTSNTGDINDFIIFSSDMTKGEGQSLTQVNVNTNASFAIRARPVWLDRPSNSEVIGEWTLVSEFFVPQSMLRAPLNVSIVKVQSTEGKSFDVNFTIPSKETQDDAPSNWGTSWIALPYSSTVTLYDRNGKPITSKSNSYVLDESAQSLQPNFRIKGLNEYVDSTSNTVLQDKVSFVGLANLNPGEFIYAEVFITYYKKDTSLLNVGSKNNRNSVFVEIPFSLKISEVTLTQVPSDIQPVKSGERNVSVKLTPTTKLKVTAKVVDGNNSLLTDISNTVVKCIMPALKPQSGSSSVLVPGHEHVMTYSSGSQEWEAVDLVPIVDMNYTSPLSSVVLVFASNPNSSNVADFRFI